jgi:hypothetical protein
MIGTMTDMAPTTLTTPNTHPLRIRSGLEANGGGFFKRCLGVMVLGMLAKG